MDTSSTLAVIVFVLMAAMLLFRVINFRRLNSRNASDRSLKVFYIIGLGVVLLFVVGEVLLQTHII